MKLQNNLSKMKSLVGFIASAVLLCLSSNAMAKDWEHRSFTSTYQHTINIDFLRSDYLPHGDVADVLWINLYGNLNSSDKVRAVIYDYCDNRSDEPTHTFYKDLYFTVDGNAQKFTGQLEAKLPINLRQMSYYADCRQEITITINDNQRLSYQEEGVHKFPFSLK